MFSVSPESTWPVVPPYVEVGVDYGTEGLPEHASYNAILISAAFLWVPLSFAQQLAFGGRLVQPDGDAETFHAFKGLRYFLLRCGDMVRQGDKPRRIDWILLKNGRHRLRTEAHTILRDRDAKPAIYPSDHYPILATLALLPFPQPSSGLLLL
jgi:hypothetical protein